METREEIIQKYKEEQLINIKNMISETGGIGTFMQLVGIKKGLDKPIIVHIETPFENDEDKEMFIEDGIPMICKGLKGEEITPICVSFFAEAWMKIYDKQKGKESEKKEVVIMTISSEESDKMYVYDIIRHPYEVDENGELISKTELSDNGDVKGEEQERKGRFTNLYEKFTKGLK